LAEGTFIFVHTTLEKRHTATFTDTRLPKCRVDKYVVKKVTGCYDSHDSHDSHDSGLGMSLICWHNFRNNQSVKA